MTIANRLKSSREKAGVSLEALAKKIGVDTALLDLIENPESPNEAAEQLLAAAMEITLAEFRGEKPPEPSPEQKREAVLAEAKYPMVRQFILDPGRCENARRAEAMLGSQPFSLVEKNIVLYLSTAALYHFCDTNTSSFAFDQYLFALHSRLLARFERQLDARQLPPGEKEELLDTARSNVFACERVENIAVLVLEPFTRELEEKLSEEISGFEQELDLPFVWSVDEDLMKIVIQDPAGAVRHQIKLLDARPRE